MIGLPRPLPRRPRTDRYQEVERALIVGAPSVELLSAEQGLEDLGVLCERMIDPRLVGGELVARRDTLIVGCVPVLRVALARAGVEEPTPYPEGLHYGRAIGRTTLGTLVDITQRGVTVWAKSVRGKVIPGAVYEGIDLAWSVEIHGPDLTMWWAPVVRSYGVDGWFDGWAAEWRLYVRDGDVVGCSLYRGAWDVQIPDPSRLAEGIARLRLTGSVDVGVQTVSVDSMSMVIQRSMVVEVNPGYALGNYGLDPVTYAKILLAWWARNVPEGA